MTDCWFICVPGVFLFAANRFFGSRSFGLPRSLLVGILYVFRVFRFFFFFFSPPFTRVCDSTPYSSLFLFFFLPARAKCDFLFCFLFCYIFPRRQVVVLLWLFLPVFPHISSRFCHISS